MDPLECDDAQLLRKWAMSIRDRLYDESQGGCPEVRPGGKRWRYCGSPRGLFNMDMSEAQALMRLFGLEELEGVEPGGECGDCVHGVSVSSSCGFWPHISDCAGCRDPQHQHFIPHKDLHLYENIEKKMVFIIPGGGTIPIYVERLKRGMEDAHYDYYESGGYVRQVIDGKRICRIESLGQLSRPGHKRNRR